MKDTTGSVLTTTYRIKRKEPIWNVSFGSFAIYTEGTTEASTHISIKPPKDVQQSDPPLDYNGGKFTIMCPDAQGNEHFTQEMAMQGWEGSVDARLHRDIPHFSPFKVLAKKPMRMGFADNQTGGTKILIHMLELEGEVPQCEIRNSSTEPLTIGNGKITKEKIRNYAESLWFDPVPLEMLYSPARKPQVLVKVNGLEALCPKRNCDFIYYDADDIPDITSVEYDETLMSLTISAEDVNNFEISSCLKDEKEKLKIEFAGVACGGIDG